jgi:hypothetical protein
MRAFLAACVAFGAISIAALPPAHAEVVIGVPGAHVDIGGHPHDRNWDHRHFEPRHERCYGRDCRR